LTSYLNLASRIYCLPRATLLPFDDRDVAAAFAWLDVQDRLYAKNADRFCQRAKLPVAELFESQVEEFLFVVRSLSLGSYLRENDRDTHCSAIVDNSGQHVRKIIAFSQLVCLHRHPGLSGIAARGS
jgi:hypothetical protein